MGAKCIVDRSTKAVTECLYLIEAVVSCLVQSVVYTLTMNPDKTRYMYTFSTCSPSSMGNGLRVATKIRNGTQYTLPFGSKDDDDAKLSFCSSDEFARVCGGSKTRQPEGDWIFSFDVGHLSFI